MRFAAAVLLAMAASPAWAQFAITVVDATGEHPPGAVLDLGGVAPAEAASVRFRLRNASDQPAFFSALAVRGTGFSIAGAPALPAGVPARQAVDFSVAFQATTVAGYSAELDVEGYAVLLTATVVPRLTLPPLGPIDFGSVEAGSTTRRRLTVANMTASTVALPPFSTTGDAFTASVPGAPVVLGPAESAQFDVVFRPPGPGTWTGTLRIDDRSYPLTGTATALPLPVPSLSIQLAEAASARDGSIAVTFSEPARTAGEGTITLDFTPLAPGATDPAIQLGVVGRWLPFTVAPADTGVPPVNFQTGTTAGKIAISVELGGVVDRKEIVIPAAPVAILSAQASRTATGIDLRITGFDNTRTAGAVTFTFFDSTGAALPAIPADYTADFAAWFAASDQGGVFLLRSVFPVTGDASKIVEFAVQMTNSAGSTTTGRVKF